MANKTKAMVETLKKDWKKDKKHRTEFEGDLKTAALGLVEKGKELISEINNKINVKK